MTDDEQVPNDSPLTQSVTRDGKTVRIEIYEDGEGGWLLEVVDEYGNSAVWEDSFASDQEALDEAFSTIDEEGIESLIGAPPARAAKVNYEHALSEAEIEELDNFFDDEALQETSMDVATLEGYLTAIAIGPQSVKPSQWLPWVWDMDDGEAEPEFVDDDQAKRILSLIMRLYNGVIRSFMTNPDAFEPMFWRGKQRGATEWCEGFLLGFQFNDEAWALLSIAQPKWFTPFMRLGTSEGIDITASEGDAGEWMREVEPSVARIHAYWNDRRDRQACGIVSDDFRLGVQKEVVPVVRGGPKIGRNDPCPCGSGKKFKKCCGAAGTPSSVQ